jgi:regulatory protein
MEIELDGASSFILPQDRVLSLGLARGDDIAPGRLRDLESLAERAEAMRIALRYLSVRPRSRRELVLKLQGRGVPRAAADEVLRRCDELGYLDDAAFAAAFARDRIRLKPCGVRRLMADLRSRGVSDGDAVEGIRVALEDERVDEPELLDRAARKRVRSLGRLEPDIARRRLFAFLTRRGFSGPAVRDWLEKHDRESG